MAIGSQFFQNPLPELPRPIQTLPSTPKRRENKNQGLYSPDFEKKILGSKKQQRLSNLAELLKYGYENNDFDAFNFRHNPFENLNQDFTLNTIQECPESLGPSYRLCRHEKEIRSMVKRNKFGYETVSKVESSIVDFISLKKPGQLSLHLKDSFERLLIHILCRYYRLVSFSNFLLLKTQV